MNPLTITRNQNVMNERELRLGYTGTQSSWHRQYKDSAWIYVGGLNFDLTEGDIICVFSQYGEIANLNMVRDKDTGKSKGFAFVCYENQKSTVLATDNLNGIKLGGRVIRVDHVEKYKVPRTGMMRVGKEDANQMPTEEESKSSELSVSDFVREYGCGPEVMQKIARLQKEAAEKQKVKEIRNPEPSSLKCQYDNISPPRQRIYDEFKHSSPSPPRHQKDVSSKSQHGRSRSSSRYSRHRRVASRDGKSFIVSPSNNQAHITSPNKYRHSSSSVSPSKRFQDLSRYSAPRRKHSSSFVKLESQLYLSKHHHKRLSSKSPHRRSKNVQIDLKLSQDHSRSPLSVHRRQEQRRLPSVSPERGVGHLSPPSHSRRQKRSQFS